MRNDRLRARAPGLRSAEHRAPGDPGARLRDVHRLLRRDVGLACGRPDVHALPDTAGADRDRGDSRPLRRLGPADGDGAAVRRVGGRVDEGGSRVRAARRPRDRSQRYSCIRATGSSSTRRRASRSPLRRSPRGRSRLSRAWLAPGSGRFAVLGAASAAAALARPAFRLLVLVAALPLVLRLPWRTRLACAPPAPASHSASSARGRSPTGPLRRLHRRPRHGAFLPFYRAFTTDHIVRPENGPASRELADAVRRELLPEEPYRSYGITLDEFFERGGPREFEDVVGITDRLWGWDSDYAHMRAVGIEAVEAHPLRYLSGVGKTTFEELWKPLFVALPNDGVEAPRDTPRGQAGNAPRASGPYGWGADSRRPPRILLDDTGRAHPRDVDVAGGSLARLRNAGDAAALRRDRARCGRSDGRGSSLRRERVAHPPVQPIVEALPPADRVARRGACRPGCPEAEAAGSRARAGRGRGARRRLSGARDLHDRRVCDPGRAGPHRPRRGGPGRDARTEDARSSAASGATEDPPAARRRELRAPTPTPRGDSRPPAETARPRATRRRRAPVRRRGRTRPCVATPRPRRGRGTCWVRRRGRSSPPAGSARARSGTPRGPRCRSPPGRTSEPTSRGCDSPRGARGPPGGERSTRPRRRASPP